MKTNRFLLVAIFGFALAFSSASAQGLYFDIGFGIGPGTTKLSNNDVVKEIKSYGKVDSELSIEDGFKLGFGPIRGKPIYIVGVLGGIRHTIEDDYLDYMQFNSYLLGPGIIIYPMNFMQFGVSIGISWVANQTNLEMEMYDSDGGFAWDISAALDIGGKKNACLIGIRYFGTSNTLKESKAKQESSMISVFIRYAFRNKNDGYENNRYQNNKYRNKSKKNKNKNYEYEEYEDDEYENTDYDE
ncbi:MAG: hypothetical protein LBC75_06070 [Fibromonadaceae bacterium]|jgi:hypothetical protein|nr:hypothetical protein [Fibromonadaceae bacterium]